MAYASSSAVERLQPRLPFTSMAMNCLLTPTCCARRTVSSPASPMTSLSRSQSRGWICRALTAPLALHEHGDELFTDTDLLCETDRVKSGLSHEFAQSFAIPGMHL